MALLTIGDQFPKFNLTSVVDIDQANPEDAFVQITDETYKGWKIVFFCQKTSEYL